MTPRPGDLAWTRLCHKTIVLAAAWAEFKLALDDYGLMCHGGDVFRRGGGRAVDGATRDDPPHLSNDSSGSGAKRTARVSEPTASIAKIREAFLYVAPVHASVVRDAEAALDALVARLRHAEARVDTLTRERDEQLKITHNVHGLLVEAKRERKAAEAALADTRRALRPFVDDYDFHAADYLADVDARVFTSRTVESLIEHQRIARRALAAGDKP